MKKFIYEIALACMVLLAVTPLAFGGMTALEDTELSEVKGQVGVTIDIAFEATSGYIALMDYDGFPTDTGGEADRACITLGEFWAHGATAGTPVTGEGWTIDVGNDGTSSYLIIGIGELTESDDSGWGFNAFKIGQDPDEGQNIGRIAMTGIQMAGSTIRIEPIP